MKTGFHTLAIPGPTNMPFELRQAMEVPLEDQRAPSFPELTLPLFDKVRRIFKSESGQVFLFPGSGTGGWESALVNTLNPGDTVLCSVFGHFSHLWRDMCERFGLNVIAIEVPWGQGVPLDEYAKHLEADKEHKIKAVLACQNETATGVASNIAGVRKVLDAADHPALLFVDGVSSVASIDMRMDEWGVDVCVSGSQKGFMLPTGLAIICVSQKALEAHKTATLPRTFFSWEDMIKTNKDGWFPYTPATTLLRGLMKSCEMLEQEGLGNVFARHNFLAEGVRRAVDAWDGCRLCAEEPKWHSDTVSAIVIPEGFDSNEVVARAFNRYQLSLGVGLSKVAGRVFRIGHLGWLNELMLMQALTGAEMAMRDVGVPIELGSGVAAAQSFYMSADEGALVKAAQ
ncbi:MAG: aminotransferase class V-fold PLP-dependent enzyme [Pseudomonadota bacterium]